MSRCPHRWCARHFDSVAEAERNWWSALPLAHAACFFVRNAPSLTIDGADAPAAEWTLHKSYGLPHATARIGTGAPRRARCGARAARAAGGRTCCDRRDDRSALASRRRWNCSVMKLQS